MSEKMKAIEILKEEAKNKGIESVELVLAQALELLEAVAPRLAEEAEEAVARTAGNAMNLALPVFKPALLKMIDLNKDGQLG